MEKVVKIFYEVLVVVHLIGIAAIAHGFFSQMRSATKGITVTMLHGASTQLLTGVLMVGLRESGKVTGEHDLNMSIVGLKLLVVLVILGACVVGKRAQGDARKYWATVGALTLVNIVFAMFVNS